MSAIKHSIGTDVDWSIGTGTCMQCVLRSCDHTPTSSSSAGGGGRSSSLFCPFGLGAAATAAEACNVLCCIRPNVAPTGVLANATAPRLCRAKAGHTAVAERPNEFNGGISEGPSSADRSPARRTAVARESRRLLAETNDAAAAVAGMTARCAHESRLCMTFWLVLALFLVWVRAWIMITFVF
jgi:hypothetical protein